MPTRKDKLADTAKENRIRAVKRELIDIVARVEDARAIAQKGRGLIRDHIANTVDVRLKPCPTCNADRPMVKIDETATIKYFRCLGCLGVIEK